MKIGDIISYQGKVWKVSGQNRDYGTFVLVSFDAVRIEVPAALKIDPLFSTTGWPFVALPTKAFKAGRVIEVRRDGVVLQPMVDWVPSDMLRAGGSLFFNPNLGISVGEVLVACHEKGSLTRIPIMRGFGSVVQRKRQKERPWKPKPPVTVYDRLTGRSPFDDESES